MREGRADPPAALAVLAPRPRAPEQVPRHAGRRLDMATRVERLPVAPDQLGLVVKGVALAGPAVHEELDDSPDLGRMMQAAVPLGPRPRPGRVGAGDQGF